MAENWNSYFLRVDGNIASVFVDLSHRAEPHDLGRTSAVWLSLKMRDPRADGLSSGDEADQLWDIEDALTAVAKDHDARFVGRVTHNGLRDFFFYAAYARQARLVTALKRRMRDFEGYEYQTGQRTDPEWTIYHGYLYPDARGFRQINDNAVLRNLFQNGDDPAKVRPVDFDFALPDKAAADALLTWAGLRGFAVTDRRREDGLFIIYLQREQNLLSIHDDLDALYAQAETLGGDMTGWGTIATP